MRAGKLFNAGTIILRTRTGTDAHGQPTYDESAAGHWYAEKVEMSARDVDVARQLYSEARHKFKGRYTPALTKDRVLDIQGVRYYVGHVTNTGGRNREMVALCSEVNA